MQIAIDDDEREDAWAALRKHGLDTEDLEFVQVQSMELSARVAPIENEVIVRRKSNGVSRAYFSGHNTAWVVEFELDLAGGKFGEREPR